MTTRLLRTMIATVALLLATACVGTPSASATLSAPAIYLVPHQDDEVLTMGADLSAHVAAGRTVIVVMVTDGAASGARAKLCAAHVACLTKAQFSDARNREFTAAMLAMGVPRANLYFENLPDGGLTLTEARAVVDKWASAYPGASMKTMSWRDLHPDHVALGLALRSAVDDGTVKDARFEQYRPYWSTLPVTGWFVRGNYLLTKALAAYSVYDPAQGRYAIGPRWSVPAQFAAVKADPRSKVHVR